MPVVTKNNQVRFKIVRSHRDLIMKATDHYYLADSPEAPPESLTSYRRALRDCTKVSDGQLVTIPDLPDDLPAKLVYRLSPLVKDAQAQLRQVVPITGPDLPF